MKHPAPVLLVCVLLCLPFASWTQIINIDKSDTADYENKYKVNINFSTGLEVDKQKITLWDATNTAELMAQHKKELVLFAASYRFTYNGPDDILNAGYFHLRFRHHYKSRFQPETFAQYQWDNKRGMASRALAGANIRYNVWKGGQWDFNTGIGLMFEAEKWNYDAVDSIKLPANTTPIRNQFLKLNSYMRLDWKAGSNSDIAFNVFLQARHASFHPRIAPHVQWNVNAGKHIGISVAFTGMYDEAPVVPISRFYYSLSHTLVYRL